jgi:hypothetical protein
MKSSFMFFFVVSWFTYIFLAEQSTPLTILLLAGQSHVPDVLLSCLHT